MILLPPLPAQQGKIRTQLKFKSLPKSSLIIYSKPDDSQMCGEEVQQTTCFSHHTSFYRWWELERSPRKGLEGRDFSVLPVTGRRRLLKCRTWHFLTLQHMLCAHYLSKAILDCSSQCKHSSLSVMGSTCWALQSLTIIWADSYEGCAFLLLFWWQSLCSTQLSLKILLSLPLQC